MSSVTALQQSTPACADAPVNRKPLDNASHVTGSAFPATVLVNSYLSASTEPADIMRRLWEQSDAVAVGNMAHVEAMLVHQSVALQAMFVDLASRAKNARTLPEVQVLTQLALKAQSGSRATLQTLADVKNPRQVAFVKQTNVAHNQQVNNGVLSPAEKVKSEQNELLVKECFDGSQKVDPSATRAAGGPHTAMVTVDAVDRTSKPHRKAKGGA